MQTQSTVGLTTYLPADFESAVRRVTEALALEGFGVLTEIDMSDTLKKKLNVDFRPYKILGVCNPSLAHRALTVAPEVGLLLPCNVTVSQMEDGRVQIAIVMMSVIQDNALEPIAEEARQRLNRVIAVLET